jgi:hypothetical protein
VLPMKKRPLKEVFFCLHQNPVLVVTRGLLGYIVRHFGGI